MINNRTDALKTDANLFFMMKNCQIAGSRSLTRRMNFKFMCLFAPVVDITKELRPISLTPCISKVAEEFVVGGFVKPAVMKILDDNQYGAIPNSSTTMALISMLHSWSLGTDGNGATLRTLLLDYRKAFDLIDHSILVRKLCNQCKLPASIINWIIDFFIGQIPTD